MRIIGGAPVPLETLGGDPRARRSTKGETLGHPGIVAVEEGSRIAGEKMNLNKTSIRS